MAPEELDRRMMLLAMNEARAAFEAGEVPIGCVVARDGQVVGRGRNAMEGLKDATAHAEMMALTAACGSVGNWRLDGCTLYATLEPCPMCAGAILNSRISRVVYAAPDLRLGACGSTMDVLRGNPINREVVVESGLMAEESVALMKEFFARLRKKGGKRPEPAENC